MISHVPSLIHSRRLIAIHQLTKIGAPYLPTYEKNMIHMFEQLRNEPQFMKQYHRVVSAQNTKKSQLNISNRIQSSSSSNGNGNGNHENKLVFVDLGSGDGRMVFHAAYREQLFTRCIGYEINPFLHAYAILKQQVYRCQSLLFPQLYRSTTVTTTPTSTTMSSSQIGPIQTEFYLRDLWKVNLQNVNVVAVVRTISLSNHHNRTFRLSILTMPLIYLSFVTAIT